MLSSFFPYVSKYTYSCFFFFLVLVFTLIGNGFVFVQEEQYLIANKTLWIQAKFTNGSILFPDMCRNTSNNTFEHPLQGCILYIESGKTK